MKTVVVSVDGSEAGRAAVRWCAANLAAQDRVVAVGGLGPVAEFVLEFPGFDVSTPAQLRDTFRRYWCAPLDAAGLRWEPSFIHERQGNALAEIIDHEHPDLVVIGKPEHLGVDLLLHGQTQHVLHHADCPVLLVPAEPVNQAPNGVNTLFEDAP
jgi:nucleotide-binding universal stress UspA family protein